MLTGSRMMNKSPKQVYRKLPVSIFWLDELAVDRITNLDVIPREFGIIPARFKHQIDYLTEV